MSRRAMTLVEMLVATTATLILMGAVAQMFALFGAGISRSRAALDLDGRMRVVAWKLRSDLKGATARPIPPLSPDSGEGYFEIIEGPGSDEAENGNFLVSGSSVVGPTDCDDVLLFTTRSPVGVFTGRTDNGTIESPTAEVAWFARKTPEAVNPETYTLYRKQLLVMGYVGGAPFANSNTTSFSSWSGYFNSSDISARREGNLLFPNTLADLTRREARFMHDPLNGTGAARFPSSFVSHQLPSTSATSEALPAALEGLIFDSASSRVGEDVVLREVLSFDVRVFDPGVPITESASGLIGLVPGDPGFLANATPVGTGAYVDLGHGQSINALLLSGLGPRFAGTGELAAGLSRVYDTWSTHYPLLGQTKTPPYPYPLRGIEVRIRCYERSTRQVRQVTVRHSFLPF